MIQKFIFFILPVTLLLLPSYSYSFDINGRPESTNVEDLRENNNYSCAIAYTFLGVDYCYLRDHLNTTVIHEGPTDSQEVTCSFCRIQAAEHNSSATKNDRKNVFGVCKYDSGECFIKIDNNLNYKIFNSPPESVPCKCGYWGYGKYTSDFIRQ